MTASDLRQHVRDKSVIIFAVLVPLALMYVFNLTFGSMESIELEPIDVAVSVPEGDELAGALVDTLAGLDAVQVRTTQTDEESARAMVRDGDAALAVVVQEGFSQGLAPGQGAVVDVVEGETAGIEAQVVETVVQAFLDRVNAGTRAATAGVLTSAGPVDPAAVAQAAVHSAPAFTTTEGEASTEQLSFSGSLVAGQAGLFLLFTVGFGVLGLLTEREQGTLARLRSMPMRPGLIVAAKALTAYVLGVVATGVLLTVGSLFFDVSFGSPLAVAVLVLCVVAAGVSLVFVVARIARTAEQAQIAQSILAMVLGMSAGAFFPMVASGLLGRILDLNPIAAFMHGLGITRGGGGIADLGEPIAIMLGFAVLATLASRLVPDRGAAA
ncbi:multidrug ABC transporter permease [Actinotalea fermentans ATCC 43279 = JCM 9966 = DSM 3133]|nr:multidrug ABC transporter permease [Actinotalea fermentans ATCC 43279 = JCM 9966 = DSM 3133]